MKKCKNWRCFIDCYGNEGKCKSSCCHNGDCYSCSYFLITIEYDLDLQESFQYAKCMLLGLDTEETPL